MGGGVGRATIFQLFLGEQLLHVKKKPGIDWSNSLLLPPAPCCREALRMPSFLMQKVKVGESQLARFSELVSSEPALWLLLFMFPRQDSGILGLTVKSLPGRPVALCKGSWL